MITRRRFLQGTAATAAALAASGLAPLAHAAGRPRTPVLVLVADDLMMPRGPMIAPNIDRLAAASTNFTEAHAAVAMCAPSRAAMWTGRSPEVTGLRGHHNAYLGRDCGPCYRDVWDGDDVFTSARGSHRTEGFGKIVHGSTPGYPGMFDREGLADFRHPEWPDGWWGPWVGEGMHPDRRIAAQAVQRIQLLDSKPLARAPLMAVGLVRPHLPWVTPRWAWDAYDGVDLSPLRIEYTDGAADLEDVPEAGRHERPSKAVQAEADGTQDELVRAYCAAATFTDAMIGMVLDAVPDDWAVIFTSDHGWMLGEKLTHSKATAWRSATRVPAMVRLPGRAPAVVDRPVSLLDLRATIEGAMFGEACGWFSSRPSVPTWWEGTRTVYQRRLHLLEHSDGSRELYHLGRDPLEATNLAGRGLPAEEALAGLLPAAG